MLITQDFDLFCRMQKPDNKVIEEISHFEKDIFEIRDEADFHEAAMQIFRFQAVHCPVYFDYLSYLKTDYLQIKQLQDIPFMPAEFFKVHRVITNSMNAEEIFLSSGTTGMEASRHFVHSLDLYRESYSRTFTRFYGNIGDYCILALLPSYLERTGASLIYMVKGLMELSKCNGQGFFAHDFDALNQLLLLNEKTQQKTLLIGVSFALLDFAEKYRPVLSNTIVMETGGMKGRRNEITRIELHDILRHAFGIDQVHSEYGMTELLSQAYSRGNGRFFSPPWMRVFIRDIYDPFSCIETGIAGGVNIIDLANIWSCSFIESKDIGKINTDGSFEILGRMDNTDIRGCNLMFSSM
ncbi:MAG: acyl transferase [Bacteroidia bacterium]|nr:acyl transferase [Bacteroidia bacterium]